MVREDIRRQPLCMRENILRPFLNAWKYTETISECVKIYCDHLCMSENCLQPFLNAWKNTATITECRKMYRGHLWVIENIPQSSLDKWKYSAVISVYVEISGDNFRTSAWRSDWRGVTLGSGVFSWTRCFYAWRSQDGNVLDMLLIPLWLVAQSSFKAGDYTCVKRRARKRQAWRRSNVVSECARIPLSTLLLL